MPERANFEYHGTFQPTEALRAEARTAEERARLDRLARAEIQDPVLEIGSFSMPQSLTEEQIKTWLQQNRGKRIVIPELRITDQGLFDVRRQEFVRL